MTQAPLDSMAQRYRQLRAPTALGAKIEQQMHQRTARRSRPLLLGAAAAVVAMVLAIATHDVRPPSATTLAQSMPTSLPSLNIDKPRVRSTAPPARVRPNYSRLRTPKRPRLTTPSEETKNVKT